MGSFGYMSAINHGRANIESISTHTQKKPTYCPFAETDLENTTVVLVCYEDWDMTEQVNEVPSPSPQNMERLM